MRGGSLGPADRVTLVRVALACVVASLVAHSFVAPAMVPPLVGIAAVALALDALDGHVARRTGTASAFGARFDGEADAFLILVLSVYVAASYGVWVLVIGAARYVFGAAGWVLPRLRRPLPFRYWRKVVTAVQGIVLVVAAADVVPHTATVLALVVALALLIESFGRDVWWLWTADRRSSSVVIRWSSRPVARDERPGVVETPAPESRPQPTPVTALPTVPGSRRRCPWARSSPTDSCSTTGNPSPTDSCSTTEATRLERARRAAYEPGEFVGQESFMRAGEIRELAVAAGVGPDVSVLDLCCGVAGPGRFITAELGCDYLGVDASPSAIAIARARAVGLPCRFEVARIPPVPAGPFDVVLLLETLLAFHDKQPLLAGIAAAIRPGGRFACTVEEGAPLTGPERAAMPDADTVWPVPQGQLVADLEKAGLRVTRMSDRTTAHWEVAGALTRAYAGERGVDDLLAAHRLWTRWLGTGRIRKLALVAEKHPSGGEPEHDPVVERAHLD